MAKSVAKRLVQAKYFINQNGAVELTIAQIAELNRFNQEIGFTHDRGKTISYWYYLGFPDWTDRFISISKLHNATLEYQCLYHGTDLGNARYISINKRKTQHFDNSPETQRSRGQIAAVKLTGAKDHSIRSAAYWVKKGLSSYEAKKKVREIQATNTLARYIKLYGIEEGNRRFNERKLAWIGLMRDPAIQKSRSLGLWRYIERYGELDGPKKYKEMRLSRGSSRIGAASKESLRVLGRIIDFLMVNNISFYAGIVGNKEWFIFDDNDQRPYFYDLTIPSLSIIIEYHGEAFHPNPIWDSARWGAWRAAYSGFSADEQYQIDNHKRVLAERNGWKVFEIYSSAPQFADEVFNKLCFFAKSSNSSGI